MSYFSVRASFRSSLFALPSFIPPNLCSRFALRSSPFIHSTKLMFALLFALRSSPFFHLLRRAYVRDFFRSSLFALSSFFHPAHVRCSLCALSSFTLPSFCFFFVCFFFALRDLPFWFLFFLPTQWSSFFSLHPASFCTTGFHDWPGNVWAHSMPHPHCKCYFSVEQFSTYLIWIIFYSFTHFHSISKVLRAAFF